MGSRYITPNVTVSKYFQIGPSPIEIDSVIVPPPNAAIRIDKLIGRITTNARVISNKQRDSDSRQQKPFANIKLLSHARREGMNELPLKKADLKTSSKQILPMSDQLIMHVHGGGFIATSTETHEVILVFFPPIDWMTAKKKLFSFRFI